MSDDFNAQFRVNFFLHSARSTPGPGNILIHDVDFVKAEFIFQGDIGSGQKFDPVNNI